MQGLSIISLDLGGRSGLPESTWKVLQVLPLTHLDLEGYAPPVGGPWGGLEPLRELLQLRSLGLRGCAAAGSAIGGVEGGLTAAALLAPLLDLPLTRLDLHGWLKLTPADVALLRKLPLIGLILAYCSSRLTGTGGVTV